MKAPAKTKNETRGSYLSRAVAKLYSAGLALPATRRAIALSLGETADGTGLLGTVDPIYYRLVGLDLPLVGRDGKTPKTPSALRAAVRRRRDSGVRWEVLAGSLEATTGVRCSKTDAKTIYSKAGGDLEASYAGRGTRVAAPKTYAADAETNAEKLSA